MGRIAEATLNGLNMVEKVIEMLGQKYHLNNIQLKFRC